MHSNQSYQNLRDMLQKNLAIIKPAGPQKSGPWAPEIAIIA
jgi:hypothetical protein